MEFHSAWKLHVMAFVFRSNFFLKIIFSNAFFPIPTMKWKVRWLQCTDSRQNNQCIRSHCFSFRLKKTTFQWPTKRSVVSRSMHLFLLFSEKERESIIHKLKWQLVCFSLFWPYLNWSLYGKHRNIYKYINNQQNRDRDIR